MFQDVPRCSKMFQDVPSLLPVEVSMESPRLLAILADLCRDDLSRLLQSPTCAVHLDIGVQYQHLYTTYKYMHKTRTNVHKT